MAEVDVTYAQGADPFLGFILKRLDTLNTIQSANQGSQYRGLITTAGSHLQHLVQRLVPQQQLRHAGHDVWLGDGLVEAYRQRRIFISAMSESLINENMARCLQDLFQHSKVSNTFCSQTLHQTHSGAFGGHTDTFNVDVSFQDHASFTTPALPAFALSVVGYSIADVCCPAHRKSSPSETISLIFQKPAPNHSVSSQAPSSEKAS